VTSVTAARPRAGKTAAAEEETTRLDRLVAATPLVTIFVWALLVYAWQAWLVRSPFVFSDELEFTQLARSLAETGEAARRGAAYGLAPLPAVAVAPAWLLSNAESAYLTAKLIGVLAMTAAIFPTYALARMLVRPAAALFAATAAVAIPAFMYSSLLIQEPFAYTISILALWLGVRALARPTIGSVALAVGAALLAPFVRGQLAVIPVILALAAGVVLWSSGPVRRYRGRWTRWDWAGAVTLAIGAVVVLNELASHRSFAWLVATRHYKDRMVDLGVAAGGALTIGLGVLPVLVGLAILVRPRGEERTPERHAFRAVLGASIVAFSFYAAVKATYLSTVFATRIYERNLIYLAPLLFVATAMWLERPRVRFVPACLAALAVALLLAHTPLILDFPYFEAPGYAMLVAGNRMLEMPPAQIAELLPLLLGVALAFVVAAALLGRRPRVRTGVVWAAAAVVLAWNVLGQLHVSSGARASADFLLSGYVEPPDWVDRAAGGQDVLYLGQGIQNPNPIFLVEFWNRSIRHVWSLDGTAPGPGPVLTPDLGDADGRLSPDPGVRYVLAEPGVDVVGEVAAERGPWRLVRIDGPLRLAQARTGITADGWASSPGRGIPAFAAYSQFATPDGQPGTMEVVVSREGASEATPPSTATVRIGPLAVGEDNQPALGSIAEEVAWTIEARGTRVVRLPTPPPPFRVEVIVDPPFMPNEVDPRASDLRWLGAQASFRFIPRGDA
jgi:hypothetical protein